MMEAFADLSPLADGGELTVRDRCLATTDVERYGEAKDAIPELSVELIEDARGLAELARGYGTVIALDESFAGLDIDGDVRIDPNALSHPTEIVPERILSWYATNAASIKAAIAVHTAVGEPFPSDIETVQNALEQLDSTGEPVGDHELERLRNAIDDLDVAVETAERVAEDALRAAIQDRDVTIHGTDLLSLVEQGASVDTILGSELSDEYEQAIQDARAHLVDAIQLTDDEASLAESVFPDHPAYPVSADDAAVNRLRSSLRADRDERAIAHKRELAATLAAHRETVEQVVRDALELDIDLAIARFAADYRCTMPRFEGAGITIEEGRSPLLGEPFEDIDPITYSVEDVVLLSGVNSGGKTALLDLIAAIVILAQMGLPVPASAVRLQRFAALHYHAATQGTLDAGAFEATLRQFGELAAGPDERLVLVDELESITEPGAAANIVAGVLETLEGAATAVFVSHLAAEVREAAAIDLRVDGIEASGVVNGELIVNRSPVPNYLARSTPELLVERLAEQADAETSAFYTRLLEKFE